MNHYEWRDDQLWDLERGCWVIWRTVSGQIGATDELREKIVRLLNDPAHEALAAELAGTQQELARYVEKCETLAREKDESIIFLGNCRVDLATARQQFEEVVELRSEVSRLTEAIEGVISSLSEIGRSDTDDYVVYLRSVLTPPAIRQGGENEKP